MNPLGRIISVFHESNTRLDGTYSEQAASDSSYFVRNARRALNLSADLREAIRLQSKGLAQTAARKLARASPWE